MPWIEPSALITLCELQKATADSLNDSYEPAVTLRGWDTSVGMEGVTVGWRNGVLGGKFFFPLSSNYS